MSTQYLRSERAHFMCPMMHFGMVLKMDCPCVPEKAERTLDTLAQAHPFLRANIGYDRMHIPYYEIRERSRTELFVRDTPDTLWEDYAGIRWDLPRSGLLKVFLYPDGSGTTVLLTAHHLLTDGVGLKSLAAEFAGLYAGQIEPAFAEEVLIGSEDDLPAGSQLKGVSRLLVKYANRQWAKEKHKVTYAQYKDFEDAYCAAHPVSHRTFELNAEAFDTFHNECRGHGVTVNDRLMAEMYLRTGTDKIIIAADIREKLPFYRTGALGNYATACSVICKGKTGDLWEKAREAHAAVSKIKNDSRALMTVLSCYFEMDPELLDAAAISALGGFDSKAASFVGKMMFGFGGKGSCSITNLGTLENRYLTSLLFIPPASPAAKLTLGVITLNGVLRACTSEAES